MNTKTVPLNGASILQLAPVIYDTAQEQGSMLEINMSYLIRTKDNKTIVIDGGHEDDAIKLRKHLERAGNHVDLWLLTHPHWDHIDAFTQMIRSPEGIRIDTLVYDFPPLDWLCAAEPNDIHIKSNTAFYQAISQFPGLIIRPRDGMQLSTADISIEVLSDPSDYQTVEYYKYINNLSVVYRLNFKNGIKALFLGDLGPHAAIKLMEKQGQNLKSDIVQMSHHGFHGAFHGNHTVMRDLYRLIAPDICLWPTPKWLWTNQNGQGPYTTLETRAWMDELNVKANLTTFAGDAVLI